MTSVRNFIAGFAPSGEVESVPLWADLMFGGFIIFLALFGLIA